MRVCDMSILLLDLSSAAVADAHGTRARAAEAFLPRDGRTDGTGTVARSRRMHLFPDSPRGPNRLDPRSVWR